MVGPDDGDTRALPAYGDLPARSWFLAPPLRLVSRLKSAVVTLYTVQTREAYETFVREGVLLGDPTLGEPSFQEAYCWMLRQMDARLPPPREGLLWLWANPSRRRLWSNAKLSSGEVLLTVRVHRDRILLSEFSDWHMVLNRGLHVPRFPGEAAAAWEARADALDNEFECEAEPHRDLPLAEWPTNLRSRLETSWEAIFDPATWNAKSWIQATMRELHPEDVVRAVRIR